MNINDCAFKNANKMEKSVGSSVFSLLLVCLFLKVKLRLDTMFKMRHEKIKEQMMHESLISKTTFSLGHSTFVIPPDPNLPAPSGI